MAVIFRPDFQAARDARPAKDIQSSELVAVPGISLKTVIELVECMRSLDGSYLDKVNAQPKAGM